MPRYVIERDFGAISESEMQAAAVRAKRAGERFTDVVWEHSHVCADEAGVLRVFCVYSAPNEERLRAHAEVFGGHVVDKIHEIVGDVTPADVTT